MEALGTRPRGEHEGRRVGTVNGDVENCREFFQADWDKLRHRLSHRNGSAQGRSKAAPYKGPRKTAISSHNLMLNPAPRSGSRANSSECLTSSRTAKLLRLETVRSKIADLRTIEKVLKDMVSRCEGDEVPECPVIDALFDERASVPG